MDWLQSIDWMGLLKCFVTGGLICVIGQILIDKTKLTPARILVAYVTAGTILGGLGIYKYLIDFAHDKVLEEYGIDLKVEQEFVNWD